MGGVVLVLNTTKGNELCLSVSGDNMNKFLNENWRDVLKVIGQPTYEALGLIAHTIATEAAKTVPFKDVFLDLE